MKKLTAAQRRVLEIAVRDGGFIRAGKVTRNDADGGCMPGQVEYHEPAAILACIRMDYLQLQNSPTRRGETQHACITTKGRLALGLPAWNVIEPPPITKTKTLKECCNDLRRALAEHNPGAKIAGCACGNIAVALVADPGLGLRYARCLECGANLAMRFTDDEELRERLEKAAGL